MRNMFSKLALTSLVALYLPAATTSAEATVLSAGGATVKAVKIVNVTNSRNFVKVGDRFWRPRYRSNSGIYFQFGAGGYSYPRPYYASPYVVSPPVYVWPRYIAPRPVYGAPSAHTDWCYARYRSYRAWDNTFRPYRGPRRACVSPFLY